MKTILSRFTANYFFSVPPETKIIWFWLGFFLVGLIATICIYFFFKRRGKSIKPYKRYAKNLLWPNLSINLLGVLLTLARYEKLTLLSWRFWVYFDLLLLVVFNVWYFMIKRNQLEDEILKFHNTKRKEKWLTK
jgi:tellurite resistance protein TehA-like permease